jgi:hypothetical protein
MQRSEKDLALICMGLQPHKGALIIQSCNRAKFTSKVLKLSLSNKIPRQSRCGPAQKKLAGFLITADLPIQFLRLVPRTAMYRINSPDVVPFIIKSGDKIAIRQIVTSFDQLADNDICRLVRLGIFSEARVLSRSCMEKLAKCSIQQILECHARGMLSKKRLVDLWPKYRKLTERDLEALKHLLEQFDYVCFLYESLSLKEQVVKRASLVSYLCGFVSAQDFLACVAVRHCSKMLILEAAKSFPDLAEILTPSRVCAAKSEMVNELFLRYVNRRNLESMTFKEFTQLRNIILTESQARRFLSLMRQNGLSF